LRKENRGGGGERNRTYGSKGFFSVLGEGLETALVGRGIGRARVTQNGKVSPGRSGRGGSSKRQWKTFVAELPWVAPGRSDQKIGGNAPAGTGRTSEKGRRRAT